MIGSHEEEAFQASHASLLEGGVFYPVGYIVAGVPNHQDGLKLLRILSEAGWEQHECMLATAGTVAKAAAAELESEGAITAFGSSGKVREKQLRLAQEGCDFLIVKAETEEDREQVLATLAQVPVRYAVRYGRLVIEDLIGIVPSATPDQETGRQA